MATISSGCTANCREIQSALCLRLAYLVCLTERGTSEEGEVRFDLLTLV